MKTLEKTSILYLDDEEMCLGVFADVFGYEYDVRTVSTLAEARAALNEQAFDIVISDQLMPEIDGVAFLREVAQNHRKAFRLMLTGSISLGQVISEVGAGIIHLFVTKPWTEPNIRQALERASMNSNDTSRTARLTQATRDAA